MRVLWSLVCGSCFFTRAIIPADSTALECLLDPRMQSSPSEILQLSVNSVCMNDVGDFHESGVTHSPSALVVGSSSSSDVEAQKRSAGPALSFIPTDNGFGSCNEGHREGRTPTFLYCFDQKAQDSSFAQTDVVPYSGAGIGPTTAAEAPLSYSLPASKYRSLELDKAGQAREAEQVEHVRKLEAECDRLDASYYRLEVELHKAQTARVQARAKLMEETVKREDFFVRPFHPILAQTQSHSPFSPMQELDSVVSRLPSQKGTAPAVIRSITRKRQCPTSGADTVAHALKRRRCN